GTPPGGPAHFFTSCRPQWLTIKRLVVGLENESQVRMGFTQIVQNLQVVAMISQKGGHSNTA
ncbi:hypothetical protein, partial [Pantoea dispersa]|uniref:hypothetical protein n=1 Tax=Pantoea dispersa TaxID=59814 RepID=UPI001C65FCC7